MLQGDFFNWASPENVSRLAPPQICLDWPSLNFLSVGIIFTSPDTQTFSDHQGGPVWDSDVFFKSVTYRQTLSKFRGGPVKKNTLYMQKFFGGKIVCNTAVFFRHLILLACQKVVRLYYAADNLISRQGATSFCKVKSGGTANICNLDILTTLTLRQCELEFQYLRPLSTLYSCNEVSLKSQNSKLEFSTSCRFTLLRANFASKRVILNCNVRFNYS